MSLPGDNTIGTVVKNAGKGIWDKTFGRLTGAGIRTDSRIAHTRAKWSGRQTEKDWRVKLTIPVDAPSRLKELLFDNDILGPLAKGDNPINGILWPITPSIIYSAATNYNALAQVHSNYPFQAYQNSQPNDINIIGDFIVQNSEDAKYWIASINFLRAVHKMFFGGNESDYRGNPPPILHLSGYGDQMFNKIPVVLNQWNVELRAGVDYICTQQQPYGGTAHQTGQPFLQNITSIDDVPATWAPTISMVSVMITPIYSRDAVKKFSMRGFVDGTLSKETGIGWV
jgi:hypothetical protein